MATSSITKNFVIKDKAVYEKFIKDVVNTKTVKKEIQTAYLEEGKKALAKYFSR